MKLCGKLIKAGLMPEARPCIQKLGHRSSGHTPDLVGFKFGYLLVIKRARNIKTTYGRNRTAWIVENACNGKRNVVRAYNLLDGKVAGVKHGFAKYKGKMCPIYASVRHHFLDVSETLKYDMPFYSDWDPRKGGALWKGTKWIIENLGRKPSPEWSIDVIECCVGFVPGNIRWAKLNIQGANKWHKKLGTFSIKEIRTEAKRHGYKLVKI